MPVRSPSRAWAQWHWERTWLAYRCGGSAGIASPDRSDDAVSNASAIKEWGAPASRFTSPH